MCGDLWVVTSLTVWGRSQRLHEYEEKWEGRRTHDSWREDQWELLYICIAVWGQGQYILIKLASLFRIEK